ncbi:hypothetical protein [Pararhizobium sp. LjRoot238]|uniref:hypothetical protein n=1 Tax=Pararhizobium sp. LjRoot238 TaxID=3342293 RepID=UPI003ECEFDA2
MTEPRKKISILPQVALGESAALIEHYRNRNLSLAQSLYDSEMLIVQLQAQIDALSPAEVPDGE